MGGIGTGELVLIFMVVLLVFGAKRIPEIAATGVDLISVGALTHSSKALDISLEFAPNP